MRVVDLTHAYSDEMPVYPGLPRPSFAPIARVEADGYAMSEYHLLNHIGTHVDAPSHQIAGGDTLDEIGLERLVTDAVTIDVSQREKELCKRRAKLGQVGNVRHSCRFTVKPPIHRPGMRIALPRFAFCQRDGDGQGKLWRE